MRPTEPWIDVVTNALRPRVGALAYILVEEALDAANLQPEEMTMRNMPSFLRQLRELLPEGVDREATGLEVGRELMNCLLRKIANSERNKS